MSAKDAVKFYDKVMRDLDLKSKLGDVDPRSVTEEVFNERIVPEAKNLGYDFTYADLQEYYNPSEKLELSVDEMESVSGGANTGGSCSGGKLVANINNTCEHYIGGSPKICQNCKYSRWHQDQRLYCHYGN